MNARRALSTFAVLALAACGGEGYDNNDAELAVHQKAKEMCSCLFVMELTEAQCAAWTKVSPNVASAEIDREAKRVRSTALGFWAASARFDGRNGCVLEGE